MTRVISKPISRRAPQSLSVWGREDCGLLRDEGYGPSQNGTGIRARLAVAG